MPVRHIRKLAAKKRTKKADAALGLVLSFIAGAINAGGFLAVGYYTSHMTGIASSIADYIVVNRYNMALASVFFLFSFITGAGCSSYIINWGRERRLVSLYALPLMLEAVLLLIFGLLVNLLDFIASPVNVTVSLLCFIMGLQNAMITKISRAEIRTTHITGMSTDIGIELGRMFFRYTCKSRKRVIVNRARLRLHILLISSFIAGGVIGAYAFKQYGFSSTIPLALMLLVIAVIPITDDIRHRRI